MKEYAPLIYGAITCLLLLKFFYELAEVQWPNYYFSSSEKTDYYASTTPYRFVLFRALPIAMSVVPVLGVLANMGQSATSIVITGLVIGIIHVALTNGKAVYRILRNSREIVVYFNKMAQIATHVLTIALCLATSLSSAYFATTNLGKAIAPNLAGIRDNFWSSILVLVLGIFAYKNFKNDTDRDSVFEKALADIKPETKSFLQEKCLEYQANYNLALAICVTEAIQRPTWLRSVERIKAFFYGPGTYGIMQAKSDTWITDEQSIDFAIKAHLQNSASFNEEHIVKAIERYNQSKAFQDWALHAYSYLTPPPPYEESTSDNGGSEQA